MKAIEVGKQIHSKEVFDHETGDFLGEVEVQVKRDKKIVESRELFFSTYMGIIGLLKELSGAECKLMTVLCMSSEHNSNLIFVNRHTMDLYSQQTGLSKSTIYQGLGTLVEKGILMRKNRGVYRINPTFYWKGDKKARKKTYRYFLEIECPDCPYDPNEEL